MQHTPASWPFVISIARSRSGYRFATGSAFRVVSVGSSSNGYRKVPFLDRMLQDLTLVATGSGGVPSVFEMSILSSGRNRDGHAGGDESGGFCLRGDVDVRYKRACVFSSLVPGDSLV